MRHFAVAVGGDEREVIGRRIVVIVRQAAGIDKGCILRPDFMGFFRHHLCESLDRTGHMLGHGHRGIVARAHDHALEQLAHGHLIAGLQPECRPLCSRRVAAHRHHLVELAMLQRNDQRHDLRRAGGETACPHVAVIEHPARLRVHDHRRAGR